MPTLERLAADDLRAVIAGYADALAAHREAINRLNVYPVPDGDTGTNMALTLESVVDELDGAGADLAADVQGHQPRLAHGGPGQLRRDPLARSCAGCPAVVARGRRRSTAAALADALDAGVRRRLRAVMRPVEGTILTVVREAAEAAGPPPTAAPTSLGVLEAARRRGGEALAAHPGDAARC